MGKKGNGNGNGAGNIPLWWMGISFFIYYSSLSTCPDDWISLYLPSLPSGSLLLYFFFFLLGTFYIHLRVGSWNHFVYILDRESMALEP